MTHMDDIGISLSLFCAIMAVLTALNGQYGLVALNTVCAFINLVPTLWRMHCERRAARNQKAEE